MLPEIVFLAKTEDTVFVYADFLVPDIERLIIFKINRWIQTVLIESDNLSQKLPCPMNCIVLEVITK